MQKNILAAVLIFLMGFVTSNVLAISSTEVRLVSSFLIKGSKYADRTLPAAKIEKYAAMASKPGGTKLVGEELATLNLPNAVIEDSQSPRRHRYALAPAPQSADAGSWLY